jgi:hypothetical protein
LLCEPLETTANGKRLVVEDSAACQKTIQTPVAQQVLKTDGAGNLTWTNGANSTILGKDATGLVVFSQVTTNQIADSSVTTAKIADLSVTTAKIADLSVTTAKIADNSVTSAKIVDGTIVNADINASAAIDGTKVNPQFGSQNIQSSADLYLVADSTINSVMSCATNTGYPIFQLRRYRGTQASPAIVQDNDVVGQTAYYGHDGSGNTLAGTVTAVVDGTPSSGKIPISIDIATRNDANQYNSRVFISGINGDVGINTGTPASKFHVAGDVSVSSATTATTVGAAGGASALPATPVGYLVVNINGTARKIPYYNV